MPSLIRLSISGDSSCGMWAEITILIACNYFVIPKQIRCPAPARFCMIASARDQFHGGSGQRCLATQTCCFGQQTLHDPLSFHCPFVLQIGSFEIVDNDLGPSVFFFRIRFVEETLVTPNSRFGSNALRLLRPVLIVWLKQCLWLHRGTEFGVGGLQCAAWL